MKDKIISISFVAVLFIILITTILTPDEKISKTERRSLYTLPKLNYQTLANGNYLESLEKYNLDQIIFRENFRKMKINYELNIINKLDSNNLYVANNHIFKIDNVINQKSIKNFTDKINNINNIYFKDMKVYYSIIPPKDYYLKSNIHLKLDFNKLNNTIHDNLNNMKYIDLIQHLDLNSYYNTDTHWKQEKLENVVNQLAINMNFINSKVEYKKKYYEPFYGVYYGQLLRDIKADKITYLTADFMDNVQITSLENKITTIYNLDNLNSLDPYNIFLSGAEAIIEINNDASTSSSELIIFRDSYGSSLAPLLISSYKKITLIDLRYISSDLALNKIELKNQDVLFIYSTLLINNSFSLKT